MLEIIFSLTIENFHTSHRAITKLEKKGIEMTKAVIKSPDHKNGNIKKKNP